MERSIPNINETLDSFLAEQRRRLAPRTYVNYEDVIRLFAHSMDGYAYQSLSKSERKIWEKAFNEDEEAGSFCNTFGPDKIPENVSEFLGYFMIRKVFASEELLKASGTVIRKLLKWLKAHDLIEDAETQHGLEVAGDLGRDISKAGKLSLLLGELCVVPVTQRVLEEWEDDYASIAKVEPGKLWFRAGFSGAEVVGPIAVPKGASAIAQEGWDVSAVRLVRTSKGWRMSEVGNVYP